MTPAVRVATLTKGVLWSPFLLGSSLVAWWDASLVSSVTSAFVSTGVTGTGTSGLSALTTSSTLVGVVVAGELFQIGSDFYTAQSVSATTITTTGPLINTYAAVSISREGVSSWASRVGGISATQATGANQPSYSAIGFNNHQAIVGDGVNSFLQSSTTTLALTPPYWMFVTASRATQNDNNGSGVRGIIGIGPAGGSESYGFAVQRPGVDPAQTNLLFGGTYGGSSGNLTPFSNGSSAIISLQSNADGSAVGYLNAGTGVVIGAGSMPAFTGGDAFLLAVGGNPVRRFAGGLGDVLIGTMLLSTITRQKFEGYEAWKWGLVANLPANHPYKNAPPRASIEDLEQFADNFRNIDFTFARDRQKAAALYIPKRRLIVPDRGWKIAA